MTVIHISTAETWRGGEQQVVYLAGELGRRGVNQLVVCPIGSPLFNWCSQNSIRLKGFYKGLFYRIIQAIKLSRLCRMTHEPVIHAHDSHSHTIALLSAMFFMNKTPIVVHRRVGFEFSSGRLSILKYEHASVRAIACVSEFVKTKLAGQVNRKEHLVVVHDAADPSKFSRVKANDLLRQQYNLSPGHILVGNLSALTPEKDLFTYVDMAAYVGERKPETRFFIIGGGPLKEKIEAYIQKKGLTGKVFLTGFLDNIPEVLPELDLCVTTSRMEGLGTSLLDAFCCRVPVVATSAGGIIEVVKDNVSGLTAPVGDAEGLGNAALQILEDPELRDRLIQNAYRMLEEFSVARLADHMADLYRTVRQETE